jgi:hypothetical protein
MRGEKILSEPRDGDSVTELACLKIMSFNDE